MVKTKQRKDRNKIEKIEDINKESKDISQTGDRRTVSTTPSSWWEERKNISQTGDRRTVSTTPSSWWEERKMIEQPNPEDQERHYREEQERYEQERESPEYNIPEVSKVCDDPYLKQYNPGFESTEALFGKVFELSKNTSPEKFMEFYSDWMETLQNSFCKFYQIPTLESNKEAYDMWIKSYGKMHDELLAPMKNASKIYIDTFTSISNIWARSYQTSKDSV